MKSLNDILWNKEGEIGEEKGKNNEYQPMGEPPLLIDSCGSRIPVLLAPGSHCN